MNHQPSKRPMTNGQSAETPGTRQGTWQMREMRANLTLYHSQPSILNNTEEYIFLARPILDQRFVENGRVLTAESPTAKI